MGKSRDEDEYERLMALVDEIPGDVGWWKDSAEEVFREAAVDLVGRGFDVDSAADLLARLYAAVAECYGGS